MIKPNKGNAERKKMATQLGSIISGCLVLFCPAHDNQHQTTHLRGLKGTDA